MLPGLLPIHGKTKIAPQVIQRTTYGTPNVQVTTIPVTFAAVAAGALILIEICTEGGVTITTPSGYTLLQAIAENVVVRTACFYKVAAGGETGVNITVSNTYCAALMREIRGYSGVPSATSYGTGNSTAPDPANLTPAGGQKSYLWLAEAIHISNTVSAFPSGYVNGITAAGVGGGSNDMRVSSAEKAATGLGATSENPGAYTTSAGTRWIAYTLAISP